VTSEAGRPDELDGLAVYQLRADKLRLRWRGSRAAARVVAVTHGVLDNSGRLALIAVLVDAAGQASLIVVS
jgi:hypothetical protein